MCNCYYLLCVLQKKRNYEITKYKCKKKCAMINTSVKRMFINLCCLAF